MELISRKIKLAKNCGDDVCAWHIVMDPILRDGAGDETFALVSGHFHSSWGDWVGGGVLDEQEFSLFSLDGKM